MDDAYKFVLFAHIFIFVPSISHSGEWESWHGDLGGPASKERDPEGYMSPPVTHIGDRGIPLCGEVAEWKLKSKKTKWSFWTHWGEKKHAHRRPRAQEYPQGLTAVRETLIPHALVSMKKDFFLKIPDFLPYALILSSEEK